MTHTHCIMAFASSSSTTPKPVMSNAFCDLGLDSEQHKIQLITRHAQHRDIVYPLPLQSSFHTVHGITDSEAGTNLHLGCPSSCKLNDIEKKETYPSSGLSSPESPPLTDNNFPTTSVTTEKEASSSHSKNHFFLSSILDLKRFNPEIKLKNIGCVARDHLASERTFIAYVHTSLCLSSAGAAVVQVLTISDFTISKSSEIPMLEVRMKRFAVPLGVTSQVLALCILFLGE